MKLKLLQLTTCLLLPLSSAAYAGTVDEYIAGLKKEAAIGNTEAQKEINQLQEIVKKANAGDAEAQYQLGMFYKSQNKGRFSYYIDKVAEQKQEEWLIKAGNQGNIDAQRELVLFYLKKDFESKTEQNKKIETWMIKLAQSGEAKYQYALAKFYQDSHDETMISKAGEWIKKAAEQGLLDARFDLGEGYLRGIYGIDKNYNKAFAIYEKLYEEHYVGGAYFLAQCYFNGYGVQKDEVKALQLYKLAAESGQPLAANYLSTIYFKGLDKVVTPDKDEFWKYYNIVCQSDSERNLTCSQLTSDVLYKCVDMNGDKVDVADKNPTSEAICQELAEKVRQDRR